jgi:hypothetical protein
MQEIVTVYKISSTESKKFYVDWYFQKQFNTHEHVLRLFKCDYQKWLDGSKKFGELEKLFNQFLKHGVDTFIIEIAVQFPLKSTVHTNKMVNDTINYNNNQNCCNVPSYYEKNKARILERNRNNYKLDKEAGGRLIRQLLEL